jgi:hypothetical protein
LNRCRCGPRHNDSTPPPCSVGFVSTRSPACKPAIRFASFSGEADSGCWLIGRFVGRERRSHISSWADIGPTVTWPKPRPRSSVWQACAWTASSYVTSCCCDYTLYWRGLTAIPRPTRAFGIATATRRERLATRGISPTGRAPGAVGALDAKWASPIVKARPHDLLGPCQVKRG